MKISSHQPYFFPYIGYFSLVKYSDLFVLFDSAQYIRHGWINRNRILHPTKNDTSYIIVPLCKVPYTEAINKVKIDNSQEWKERIICQLKSYKKQAPFYRETMDFVEECFQYKTDYISDLNVFILKKTCEYLNIATPIKTLSKMDLKIDPVHEPDEWGLNITKALQGTVYINAPGGLKFYNREKYKEQNIDLQFIKNNLHEYDQKREKFEMGLSILDVMMFNSPEEIHKMLDDYEVI